MTEENFESMGDAIRDGRIDADTSVMCERLDAFHSNKNRVDVVTSLDFLTCRSRILDLLHSSCNSIIGLRNIVDFCNKELARLYDDAVYLDSTGATYKSTDYASEVALLRNHIDGLAHAVSKLRGVDVHALMIEFAKAADGV